MTNKLDVYQKSSRGCSFHTATLLAKVAQFGGDVIGPQMVQRDGACQNTQNRSFSASRSDSWSNEWILIVYFKLFLEFALQPSSASQNKQSTKKHLNRSLLD